MPDNGRTKKEYYKQLIQEWKESLNDSGKLDDALFYSDPKIKGTFKEELYKEAGKIVNTQFPYEPHEF